MASDPRFAPGQVVDGRLICAVEACGRPVARRQYCDQHYRRFRKYGDPTAGYIRLCASPEQAIRTYVRANGSCVEWTGSRDDNGYGRIMAEHPTTGERTSWLTHRYAWTLERGPIPAGLELDHICHNPSCIKLEHLRLATHKQNQEHRRGAQVGSKSRVRGVHWDGSRKAWAAKVTHSGKIYFLGRFPTIEAAEAAVTAKRNELFTHNDKDRRVA